MWLWGPKKNTNMGHKNDPCLGSFLAVLKQNQIEPICFLVSMYFSQYVFKLFHIIRKKNLRYITINLQLKNKSNFSLGLLIHFWSYFRVVNDVKFSICRSRKRSVVFFLTTYRLSTSTSLSTFDYFRNLGTKNIWSILNEVYTGVKDLLLLLF